MNSIPEILNEINALGGYSLVAFYRDSNRVTEAIRQLPYIEILPDNNQLQPAIGTTCRAIRGITLKDGSPGFAIATGGRLSANDFAIAKSLLEKDGEDLLIAVPEGVREDFYIPDFKDNLSEEKKTVTQNTKLKPKPSPRPKSRPIPKVSPIEINHQLRKAKKDPFSSQRFLNLVIRNIALAIIIIPSLYWIIFDDNNDNKFAGLMVLALLAFIISLVSLAKKFGW